MSNRTLFSEYSKGAWTVPQHVEGEPFNRERFRDSCLLRIAEALESIERRLDPAWRGNRRRRVDADQAWDEMREEAERVVNVLFRGVDLSAEVKRKVMRGVLNESTRRFGGWRSPPIDLDGARTWLRGLTLEEVRALVSVREGTKIAARVDAAFAAAGGKPDV